MNENADEIVRGLRYTQKKYENKRLFTGETDVSAMARDAADLIESQQSHIAELEKRLAAKENTLKKSMDLCDEAGERLMALGLKLAESQRRELAAVEDLELNAACPCRVCKNAKCYRRNGRENCKFEWRGPQAGKGEAE